MNMAAQIPQDYSGTITAILAAGAIGDAWGGVVEFDSVATIHSRFGDQGLSSSEQLLQQHPNGLSITDDTQMTLFVLDGLLEWIEWANQGYPSDPTACVWLSLLRWWQTQNDGALPDGAPPVPSRWLVDHRQLHHRRAPGRACLSGLNTANMPTLREPANPQSKGCGTVMRSAPYGMVPGLEDHLVVSMARQGAVLTHGMDEAWVSSAAFALMISALMSSGPTSLTAGVEYGHAWAREEPAAESVARRLDAAVLAAQAGAPANPLDAVPTELGEGWVAEEALAIAVYAVLATKNSADAAGHLRAAIAVAANHGGDSDSTASLAGQLLGAHYGSKVLADVPRWIVEHAVIREAADRWVAATS